VNRLRDVVLAALSALVLLGTIAFGVLRLYTKS
jgi:hypothetical protein